MTWSYWFAGILNTSSADRTMNCLPMYHSVGGIVAIGSVLVSGGSVVLQDKFSTRRFLGRCRPLGLHPCSNILANSAAIFSRRLKVPTNARIICGSPLATACAPMSGMRSRSVFNIPHIVEFYAATEGTFSLINVEGEPARLAVFRRF